MTLNDFPQIHVIGDAHLGRKFIEGVPLERRGEREEEVWEDFQNRVQWLRPEIKFVVQTGDIFDAFAVDEATELRCFNILKDAAIAHPDVVFIVYRGNHDASRDVNKKSSFDILQSQAYGIRNLIIATHPQVFGLEVDGRDDLAFGVLPWHPFKSAAELAEELKSHASTRLGNQDSYLDMVFTHCDLKSFGGSEHNVLPVKELSAFTKLIVNGHVHTPSIYEEEGVTIQVQGSMQPYSHGEDPDHKKYQTFTLEEVLRFNEGALHGMHVRVLLKKGEDLPDIDCLALTWKRVDTNESSEDNEQEVELAEFDLRQIMIKKMKANDVSQAVIDSVIQKYDEARAVTE